MTKADPYQILLLTGGLFSAGLLAAIFLRGVRRTPEIAAFSGMLAAAAIWCSAHAIALSSHVLQEKLFLERLAYLGVATFPVFWLLFAIAHSGHERWLTPPPVAAAFVFPAIAISLAWLDPTGGLLPSNADLNSKAPPEILRATPAPWYHANLAYGLAACLGGIALLWSTSTRIAKSLKPHPSLLMAAAALPAVAKILHIAQVKVIGEMDTTPFALLLTNSAIAWALGPHALFGTNPLACASVFERFPGGVFLFELSGRLIAANSAARRILQPNPGTKMQNLFAPWPPLLAAASAARKRGETASLQVETGQGAERRVYDVQIARSSPTPHSQHLLVAVWQDITERQSQEASLQKSETELQNFVKNSPMGMLFYELDEEGNLRLRGWNPAAEQILAVDLGPKLGEVITEAFPKLAGTEIPERFRAAAADGLAWESEQVDYDDGQVRGAFEVRAFQTSPRRMVALFFEISARKRAEALLARSRQFERLLITISSRFVSVPIDLLDATISDTLREVGLFCGVDRSYLFLCDEKAGTMRNTHEWCAPGISSEIERLQAVPCADYAEMFEHLRRGEAWGVPDVSALPEGSEAKRNWQSQSIQTLVVVPLRHHEELLGFIGFDSVKRVREWEPESLDLLEVFAGLLSNALARRQIELDRQRAEEKRRELEMNFLRAQKLESLGLLAGGIAHDFNNLLAAIGGNLELAESTLDPAHSARGMIANAVKACRRAADLTRQMLAFSGKGRFLNSPVDLNALIAENASMLAAALPKSTRLTIRPSSNLPAILADSGQIQQVIMNLLINASESLCEAPGDVVLETATIDADEVILAKSRLEEKPPPGRFVVLRVRDTGCGMDKATAERIFEPFFTTKFAGRGLGMSAVLGIVRAHRGALLLDSTPGRGTEIQVLFPAMDQSAVQAHFPNEQKNLEISPSQPQAHRSGASPEALADPGRITVCVVDDEEPLRVMCCEALARKGFEPLSFENGAALLAHLAAGGRADCILLDLTMPGLDGPATLAELARHPSPPPVLIMSGYGEEEILNRLADKSVARFLKKPFSMAALLGAVREVLPDVARSPNA